MGEENIWLKDLDNKLDAIEIRRITGEIHRQGKAARIKAYLDAITRANAKSLQEALSMSDTVLTLDKVLEEAGLVAKLEARGKAIGEEHKALAIAQNLINMGLPYETVISATQLDSAQIKPLIVHN